MTSISNKIANATKWSLISEISAKLITPISTIIIARILTPDAFAVLVAVTMVISFAEVFTDAGFHKYIIQKNFSTIHEQEKSVTVAFWSNCVFSIFIWLLIIIFSERIATLIGNVEYKNIISIASICIPLSGFISIQTALFKRDFDFKTLFVVRITGITIPLLITIPLAYITRNYWALIIGVISQNLATALILGIRSKWKPRLFYDIHIFKNMFSFSSLSMIESISIWMTCYVDIFILGKILDSHFLGIYRTSIVVVGQILGLVIGVFMPILYSALSRLQNNRSKYIITLLKFQKIMAFFIFPLGLCIFLFKKQITTILLGNQWIEGAYFVGLWGLVGTITILFSNLSSEVYRSLGKPNLSVLAQIQHIFFLIPAVYIGAQYDFNTLCLVRSLVRLEMIPFALIVLYYYFNIPIRKMFCNLTNIILATTSSSIIAFILLLFSDSILFSLIIILIYISTYILILNILSNKDYKFIKREIRYILSK